MADQNQMTNLIQLMVPPTTDNIYYSQKPYGDGVLFPWKLHDMLDAADEKGFTSVVSWLPDGRSFKVHDKETFVSLIMRRYFEQTKYKSFQRQLNMWGFERHLSGPQKGGYAHEHFFRGKPSLCCRMKRTKKASSKSSAKAKEAAASQEKKKSASTAAAVPKTTTNNNKMESSNMEMEETKGPIPISVVTVPSVLPPMKSTCSATVVSHSFVDDFDHSDRSGGCCIQNFEVSKNDDNNDKISHEDAKAFNVSATFEYETTNRSSIFGAACSSATKRDSIVSLGEGFEGFHFYPVVHNQPS